MEEDIFIDDMYHNYFKIYRFPGKNKKVLIISGLHGDEYTSILASNLLLKNIKGELEYNVSIIPIANMGAFLYRSRTSPYGGEDLNRIFPGKRNGSLCERLAERIFSIAMENDIIIDLHSCGFLCVPHMIALYRSRKDVMEVTRKIDVRYVVESRGTPGQLMTEALKRGKTSLIIELPSGFGGYIQDRYAREISRSLLKFLMGSEADGEKIFLGKIEKVRSERFGYFRPIKKYLFKREVKSGERIGRLDDDYVSVNRDGILISMHYPSYIFKGEVIYEIAAYSPIP
ncbi:MAG: succinylglutamate desuccinylase/aspartoacylase family protein [Thermoplasmata archaeon]